MTSGNTWVEHDALRPLPRPIAFWIDSGRHLQDMVTSTRTLDRFQFNKKETLMRKDEIRADGAKRGEDPLKSTGPLA